MNFLNKINTFLPFKQRISFFFLVILMAISAVLEIIGIGTIPIFVSAVLDYELLNRYLNKLNISKLDFISEIKQDDLLVYMSIFILVLFLSKNIFLMIVHYLQSFFNYKIVTINSEKIFNRYLFSDFSFHLHRNSSSLIKNITNEINISVTFLISILYLMRESIIFILICLLLLINSPISFTYISLVFLLILILFYQILKKRISESGKKFYESRGKLVFAIQQSLGFIKEIILLNKRNIFFDYFKKNLNTTESQNIFLNVINKVPRLTFELLAVLICILIVNFYFKNSQNDMLPILTLYGISMIRLIPSYTGISTGIINIRFFKSSFDLICSELSLEASSFKDKELQPQDKNFKYNINKLIKVNNLSFSYQENKKVLKKINFDFITGQAIGIVGSSGSGKTTLGDLIMGLYKPQEGSISLDDKNIYNHPNEWKSMIGYVPQEVFILDASIKNNIAVEFDEQNIDEKRLNTSVKMSNCEEYINQLPNKLDTQVGERGIRLSGGQRQRIGIARALYKDPSIILFDEATSSLDNKNEKEIIDSIVGLKKNKTLICISHKLSNLKNMDKIISLKNGKIDKIGSAEEVITYLEENKSTDKL
jgi:ABC-type multidrug transport system fused ATPase/permease subunit